MDLTDRGLSAESLSVAIPFYNEGESVPTLLALVHESLRDFALPWELILVDDGSEDDTLEALRAAAARYGPHVRVIELQRNFGQTAAMQAGIEAARGTLIVTLDGDAQNDPRDIPAMVQKLLEEDLDVVAGWRRERKDTLRRRLPSRVANALIGAVTGVRLHDYGCSLKVYRASVLRDVALYGEMHRFVPALIATVTAPRRIGEMAVRHHPRRHGRSKYRLGRTFRVIVDLLAVYFLMRFSARPGHFFGLIGLALGGLAGAMLGWLVIVKFVLGEPIGGRPLLLVGVVCAIAALQMLTTGVLAEMILRTVPGNARRTIYAIRNKTVCERADGEGWFLVRRS
jgi:glycosyltransferase involved in cell wall biosynthesis